ncbi:MAG: tRNA (adenosine(37)-N6)-dimethylallyltransferase MiaA [Bacteroidota bacterium]
MPYLVSIVGPTAVGKTALSIRMAELYQASILSCDSRQIYKHLSIGTAKPSADERKKVPHYLIDFLEVDQPYNAGRFERDAIRILKKEFAARKVVVATGGSTLYFDALWFGINDIPTIAPEIRQNLIETWKEKGLAPLLSELAQCDPLTFQRIDQNNPVRIIRALEVFRGSGQPLSSFQKKERKKHEDIPMTHIKIGLSRDRNVLYQRINDRVDQMIAQGFEAEVRELFNQGFDPNLQSLRSIGYKEWIEHFRDLHDRDEAIRLIKRNSRRYAKRQLTYFRRFDDIHWFEAENEERVMEWLAAQLQENL